jgi:type II secretory pathway pseudopilin PulG
MKMNKKGQIWIETVIYLLIGLALIALVLAFVLPRVDEQKDRVVVDQTLVSLSVFDEKINEVVGTGEGNRRVVDFSMRAGELLIDADNDELVFTLRGMTEPYSEPGIKVPVGRVLVESTEGRSESSVDLTLKLSGIDLRIDGIEGSSKINPSTIPYRFSINHLGAGVDAGGNAVAIVDIIRIS